MRDDGRVFFLLMALAGMLFAIGFVSHTATRHLVQAAPAAIAMLLIQTRVKGGLGFAGAVFLVWGLVVAVIFLYLAGKIHFISGTFSTVERILAAGLGILAVLGAGIALRGASVALNRTLAFFLLGAVVQIGIIKITLGPLFGA